MNRLIVAAAFTFASISAPLAAHADHDHEGAEHGEHQQGEHDRGSAAVNTGRGAVQGVAPATRAGPGYQGRSDSAPYGRGPYGGGPAYVPQGGYRGDDRGSQYYDRDRDQGGSWRRYDGDDWDRGYHRDDRGWGGGGNWGSDEGGWW